MPKEIDESKGFVSIVYTWKCGVIATPMCYCLCTWRPQGIVWQPIHGLSARQRPLRIVYMNLDLDLDLAQSAITVVTITDVGSHVKCLCCNVT